MLALRINSSWKLMDLLGTLLVLVILVTVNWVPEMALEHLWGIQCEQVVAVSDDWKWNSWSTIGNNRCFSGSSLRFYTSKSKSQMWANLSYLNFEFDFIVRTVRKRVTSFSVLSFGELENYEICALKRLLVRAKVSQHQERSKSRVLTRALARQTGSNHQQNASPPVSSSNAHQGIRKPLGTR